MLLVQFKLELIRIQGVCILSSVSVKERFNSSYPTYKLVGEPTSNPSRGSKITNSYVDVTFKYTNGLPAGLGLMSWTKTCRVKF